jgi:hypothetical protein
MRITAALLAILVLIAITGCGFVSPAKPAETPVKNTLDHLYTATNGDTVYIDTETVKISGVTASAAIHFLRKEIRDGGRREVWHASLKPAERIISVNQKLLYDDGGKQIASSAANTYWEYILPGSDTERLAQALTDYCRRNNLKLDTTPAPFIKPEFRFIAKSTANNAFYFYNPATVRVSGPNTEVQVLMVNEEPEKGVRYVISTVRLNTKDQKYQILTQSLYDAAGKQTSVNTAAGPLSAIPPGSVFDMMLQMTGR